MDELERAAEVSLVSEAADRHRTVGVIPSGDVDRIEVRPDEPAAGAALLDLRDHPRALRAAVVDDRLEEVARSPELGDALLQPLDRRGTLLRGNLEPLARDDLVKGVGHGVVRERSRDGRLGKRGR